MIKKIHLSLAISITAAVGMVFVLPTIAYGITPIQAGADAARGDSQPLSLFGASGVFTSISNTMLFVIGALSVLMFIFGGLRYVISGGNTATVNAAKNTILYAIVGLVVAMLAYAIVNFVLAALLSGTSTIGTNI